MVSMLTSSTSDSELESRVCKNEDHKIGTCCFSAKHAALRSKRRDWFVWNQNNVFEWSDMSVDY